MKIAYYLPSLYAPGGLERIITFKANYFANCGAGHEVYIITSEQGDRPEFYPLSDMVRRIDLDVPFDEPFNRPRWKKILAYPWQYMKFKHRFSDVLKWISPDITISTLRREINFIHSISDGSRKIGEFHVTRSAYHVNALKGQNLWQRLVRRIGQRRFTANLKKLARVVLLTNEEATFWPELNNITVIPNPVILPSIKRSDGTRKQVIAVGRYAPQKGFDLLIESWAIVASRHPDWCLKIYGEGMRAALQTRIDQLEIGDSCLLEHTVTDIQSKYAESAIFVLSSRYEGFGMVITEAMQCGLPPVAFACPCGPRDIIRHGEDGLLVPKGDIEALARAIAYLIEHDEVRMQMAENAYHSAKRYEMKNIARQWEKLFDELRE